MNSRPLKFMEVLVVFTLVLAVPVSSEITGIHYVVTYSVVDDAGFLSVTINVTEVDCAVYYVPVRVFDDREIHIEFLNYTATGTVVVGVDYDVEAGIAEVAACNPGTVELVFAISGLLEELGAGAYSLVVNTSELTNMGLITLELKLGIPVIFEVQVAGNLKVDLEDGERGILVLKGVGVGIITLATSVETPASEPTLAFTPTPTPTPTSTPQPTVTPAPQPPYTYIAITIVIIVAVTVAVVALRRRK